METTSFLVPSITCNICSNKIISGLQKVSGVENVSVDVNTKEVKVDYNASNVQPADIKKTVVDMGFEVS